MAQQARTGPPPGVIVRLTGGAGEKALSNGNTWEESVVNPTARVNAKELSSALAIVGKGVSKRYTLPVLGDVLIGIGPRQLVLRSTDLEITVEATIATPSNNEVHGEIAVDFKWLTAILKQLPTTATLGLEFKPATAEVRSEAAQIAPMTPTYVVTPSKPPTFVLTGDGSTFEHHGVDTDEFPPVPEFVAGKSFTVPVETWTKAWAGVEPCRSNDEARPVLTGINLKRVGNQIALCATSTHILAERFFEPTECADDLAPAVIPARDFPLPAEGELRVEFSDRPQSHIARLSAGNVIIHTRLIDGKFPNYEQVIPTGDEPAFTVSKLELINAIKRVMVSSQDDILTVKLAITHGDAVLSAGDESNGRASHHFKARLVPYVDEAAYNPSAEIGVAFSSKQMLTALSTVASNLIRVVVTSPLNPIVIRIDGDAGRTVVMPVRIK